MVTNMTSFLHLGSSLGVKFLWQPQSFGRKLEVRRLQLEAFIYL